MKKRILFVDDEPNVLRGLSRMLRPLRSEWDMNFVGSGSDALAALEKEPFDVVVTDMRMPGMDGAQLLTEVAQKHPQMVRIVLSGHMDKEMIYRSVGQAHQYLAKPCDAEMLKSTVARACTIRDSLADKFLAELVSGMSSLPSLPTLYVELVEYLQSPEASIQAVGKIIARDVGMTAKILQLVNSAFFGLSRQVGSPVQAVSLLGLDTIKALVLSVQAFCQFDEAVLPGFDQENLWRHSMIVGTLSKRIAEMEDKTQSLPDDALMAGLLHDAGKLVLASQVPDMYEEVLELVQQEGMSFAEAEREMFGATHAEVGAYLLGIWGLQDAIVEALAFHHCPAKCPVRSFAPLSAVHVADFLDNEAGLENARVNAQLDTTYLEELGLSDRIPAWREARDSLCVASDHPGEQGDQE